MFNRILIYGTGAGLIVGIPLFGMTVGHLHPDSQEYGLLIGYTIMLVALSLVFVAVKRHRDIDLGGVISFWRAFALGLGVSIVAGVFYVAAWEAALAVSGADYIGAYAKSYIAQQQAAGVTGEALAKLIREMDALKAQYADPMFRLPMSFVEIFPVGVLVSLISAGLLSIRGFLPARRA